MGNGSVGKIQRETQRDKTKKGNGKTSAQEKDDPGLQKQATAVPEKALQLFSSSG